MPGVGDAQKWQAAYNFARLLNQRNRNREALSVMSEVRKYTEIIARLNAVPDPEGAEYEALIGVPGMATTGMQPQSVTHIIIILFIIVGNAVYFITRRRGAQA